MGMSPDRYIPKGIRDMDDDDPLKEHWMSKEYVDPRRLSSNAERYEFAADKWLRNLRAKDAKMRGGRPKSAGTIPVPGSLSPEQEAYIKQQAGLNKRQRDRKWKGKIGKIGPTVSVDVPKGVSGFWNPPSDYLLAAGYYDPKRPIASLSGFKVPMATKKKLMKGRMSKKEFQRESAKDWAVEKKMAWENDMMKSSMEPTRNTVIRDNVPSVLYINDSDINDQKRAFDTAMRKMRNYRVFK
jgi:hypothetical protein